MSGKRVRRELPAIIMFSFLIGVCIVLLFNNKFSDIENYAEIFKSQVKNIDLSETKILFSVFCNRIAILCFVFLCSYFFKGKYCLYVLSSIFFFIYGIYLAMNCMALSFKGVLTGFILFIPQWLFYIFSFLICIHQNLNIRSSIKFLNIFQRIIPFILIIMGVIIETYVTLPIILKVF